MSCSASGQGQKLLKGITANVLVKTLNGARRQAGCRARCENSRPQQKVADLREETREMAGKKNMESFCKRVETKREMTNWLKKKRKRVRF